LTFKLTEYQDVKPAPFALTSTNNLFITQSFATPETENFFASGKSRRLLTEILKRTTMRLSQMHATTRIEDLRLPPSNQLEKLSGNKNGQWSIRINSQWRVCFRFEEKGGQA
jgi:proteic killer suppression protein